MKNWISKIQNLLLFSFLLPVLYGCQGGGGSDLVGALFGGSTPAGSALASAGGGLDAVASPGAVTSIHNPEPATLLLMGGGLVAGYVKNKFFQKR